MAILRMWIIAMDATGVIVLEDVITTLEHRRITVLTSGAKPEHLRPLELSGCFTTTDSEDHRLFDTTPRAIAYARMLVLPESHHTSTTNEDRS